MEPVRDDRELLLARVAQLEDEVAALRDAEKRRLETPAPPVRPPKRSPIEAASARGVYRTLVIPPLLVVLPIVVSIAILAAKRISERTRPVLPAEPTAPSVSDVDPGADVPGFPHDVDPSQLIALAREKSLLGDTARLTSIGVQSARSDGLVDLRDARSANHIVYAFTLPYEAPSPGPAPLGAPPTSGAISRSMTVEIDRAGAHIALGDLSVRDEVVPEPHCSVRDVWRAVIATGVSPEGEADIDYGRSDEVVHRRNHPKVRWVFEIPTTTRRLSIDDATCTVM